MKPKYRIIKHTNHKEIYYTLEYRGLLWGWNTVKDRICDYSGGTIGITKRFEDEADVLDYIDSLRPEITEVVKEIY